MTLDNGLSPDAASHLHLAVKHFKQWAEAVPVETRSGEWECDYPDWQRLWSAAEQLMETVPVDVWAESAMEDLLYALARDNECEVIADALAKRDSVLMAVASRATHSAESEAKWQIAVKLGERCGPLAEAEELLVHFVQDANEYVSRRALLALGRASSGKTETYAERAWATGHEYQRIAALWALKDVGSAKLDEYLRWADADAREFLVSNAREIRAE